MVWDGLESVIYHNLFIPDALKRFHIIICTTETCALDLTFCLLITDEKCQFWGSIWWWGEENSNIYSTWEILTSGCNSWQSLVEKIGIFYQWLISLESISLLASWESTNNRKLVFDSQPCRLKFFTLCWSLLIYFSLDFMGFIITE